MSTLTLTYDQALQIRDALYTGYQQMEAQKVAAEKAGAGAGAGAGAADSSAIKIAEIVADFMVENRLIVAADRAAALQKLATHAGALAYLKTAFTKFIKLSDDLRTAKLASVKVGEHAPEPTSSRVSSRLLEADRQYCRAIGANV